MLSKADIRYICSKLNTELQHLEERISYAFTDRSLLLEAMTHPSCTSTQYYALQRHRTPNCTNMENVNRTEDLECPSHNDLNVAHHNERDSCRSVRCSDDGNSSILRYNHTNSVKNKVETQYTLRNYELLEFLGDKVIGLIIADMLHNRYRDMDEGEISIVHSHFVRAESLSEMARGLGLRHIMVTLAERVYAYNLVEISSNSLEDAYEALIGAVFMDGGYDSAHRVVSQQWNTLLNTLPEDRTMMKDYKSRLQEWAQKNNYSLPLYSIVSKTGTEHAPTFSVKVTIPDLPDASEGTGVGKSRKVAEQNAALALYKKISDDANNYTK